MHFDSNTALILRKIPPRLMWAFFDLHCDNWKQRDGRRVTSQACQAFLQDGFAAATLLSLVLAAFPRAGPRRSSILPTGGMWLETRPNCSSRSVWGVKMSAKTAFTNYLLRKE